LGIIPSSRQAGTLQELRPGRIAVNERLVKVICSSFNANKAWLRHDEGDMFLETLPETLPEDKRFKT